MRLEDIGLPIRAYYFYLRNKAETLDDVIDILEGRKPVKGKWIPETCIKETKECLERLEVNNGD